MITDTAGVQNRLELSDADDDDLVVRERGDAELIASGTCRNMTPQLVRCAPTVDVEVLAGRGDDSVDAERTYLGADMAGGAGADRLVGGRGVDVLRGGDGDDRLLGGGSADELHGGPGRDGLDGGRGADTATWMGDRGPLRADLERGTATAPEGRDRLARVERLMGTGRDDRLAGDAGPNRLDGGEGSDTLIGRGGADRLGAGPLGGGADGEADRLACGTGTDTVADAGRGTYGGPRRPEPIPRGCERLYGPNANLAFETIRAHPVLRDDRRRARVQGVCNPEYSRCRLRATLELGGRVVGRTSLRRVRPTIVPLAIRLRSPLPAAGVLTVRYDGFWGGQRYAFMYRVRL